MAADIGMANQNKVLEKKIENLEEEVTTLREFKKNIENKAVEEEIEVIDNSEEKEKVVQKRKEKRKKQKAKKQAEMVKVPTTGQNILFKETDKEGWKSARVVGSWKKNSKYKYWKHLLVDKDLILEKDF